MFKYSEYIFLNEVSLPVITLTGKCLKHAHAQIWHIAAAERGCFFCYTFLKPSWEMLPFFLFTFAADLNPFKAFFFFLVSETAFQCDTTGVKQNPSTRRIWLFFRSHAVAQNTTLFALSSEAQDAELHIPIALHTNGRFCQSADSPEDKSIHLNTFLIVALC